MRLNFKFMQTDGVPLTADLMETLEEAWSIFNVIGDIAGNLTILSGCEITGTFISPGIVVIDGDVLFFEGGTIYQTVFIHTEEITKVFKNQVAKVLIEKKTVKFGDAAIVYNWADFSRISTLKKITADSISYNERLNILEMKTAPIKNGGIVWAWREPVIPVGWKECIDLRGKTIVGLDPDDPDFDSLGDDFGSKTHQLTNDQLPKLQGNFQAIASKWANITGIVKKIATGGVGVQGSTSHIATLDHQDLQIDIGNNQAHNNVQPSKIYYFIEPNFQ